MISSLALNGGSQTYSGKQARSPRADERSGSLQTKEKTVATGKTKTYAIQVKAGRLVLTGAPKKSPAGA